MLLLMELEGGSPFAGHEEGGGGLGMREGGPSARIFLGRGLMPEYPGVHF